VPIILGLCAHTNAHVDVKRAIRWRLDIARFN